jgi:DNA-binding PadR family transcriptional regulator
MTGSSDLPPLKPTHYLILLALAETDLHGYAIEKAIARRTAGRVEVGAGSLYRSLEQLRDRGLIEASAWRPDPDLDDERRTYFRLTKAGHRVASAETERLERLVAHARASGLVVDARASGLVAEEE